MFASVPDRDTPQFQEALLEHARRRGDVLAEAISALALGQFRAQEGQFDKAMQLLVESRLAAERALLPRIREQAVGTLGSVYLLRGELSLSVACFEEAAGLAQTASDLASEGVWLLHLAQAKNANGRSSEGLGYLNRVLRVGRWLEDIPLSARALLGRAQSHYLLAQPDQALQDALEAARYFRLLKDPSGQAAALVLLGGYLLNEGRIRQAADHFYEALSLSKQQGDRRTAFGCLVGLATVCRLQGKVARAREMLEEARSILNGPQYFDLEIQRWLELGKIAAQEGDAEDARACYERGLAGLQQTGLRRFSGTFRGLLASLDFAAGRLRDAETGFLAALAVAEEVGDRIAQAGWMGNLAEVEAALGRRRGAAERCEAALSICRQLGFRIGTCLILAQLGSLRLQLGEPAIAAGHLEEAMRSVVGFESTVLKHMVWMAAGRWAQEMELPQQAQTLYRECLERAQESGAFPEEAVSHGMLGLVALQKGELMEARGSLEQARSQSTLLAAGRWYSFWNGQLGRLDVADGRAEQGLPRMLDALAAARHSSNSTEEAAWLLWIGMAQAEAGRDSEAWTSLLEGLATAAAAELPFLEAAGLEQLGRMALRIPDRDSARHWLERCLELRTRISDPRADGIQQLLGDL